MDVPGQGGGFPAGERGVGDAESGHGGALAWAGQDGDGELVFDVAVRVLINDGHGTTGAELEGEIKNGSHGGILTRRSVISAGARGQATRVSFSFDPALNTVDDGSETFWLYWMAKFPAVAPMMTPPQGRDDIMPPPVLPPMT